MDGLMRDLGGAYSAVLVYIGDKLGLYKAMNDTGKPITSHELAALTKTSERTWIIIKLLSKGLES
jgi:hypothetical protein